MFYGGIKEFEIIESLLCSGSYQDALSLTEEILWDSLLSICKTGRTLYESEFASITESINETFEWSYKDSQSQI